ncbi:BON domain-containing protein [Crenobacter cavernae]|uniref:BON domain-containing protein n=1 Tax=Crenobacter cavernae TaxID=2290923 RepID=A0ABY0FHR5_9NEIS|nr:BON domain-containing protein [Crenobacter cavernae]RXZ44976.1 BON domain-containing protein [Crenobacter cavernae]
MNRVVNRATLLISLVAPLWLAACSSTTAPQTAPKAAAAAVDPDVALASSVKSALDKDASLKPLNLKVTSKKGDVKIEGAMTDDQQMLKAGLIAQDVPGVKNVVNDMKFK